MKFILGSRANTVNGSKPRKGEVTQYEAEKSILTSLFEQSINVCTNIESSTIANTAISKISKADESIELSECEIVILCKTYESIRKPVEWVYYSNLLMQLSEFKLQIGDKCRKN